MRNFFKQLFKKKEKVYCRQCYYLSEKTEHFIRIANYPDFVTCDKMIKQKERINPFYSYFEDIHAQCYRENRSNHCKYYIHKV